MTKKKHLAVILIPVDDFSEGRKAAERVENQTFKSCDELRKEVRKIGIVEDDVEGEITFYKLTDFMDSCNNQEINLEQYWVSYVYLLEKLF